MTNEQLTEAVEKQAQEISDLKRQVQTLKEFGENVVEMFQKMQE